MVGRERVLGGAAASTLVFHVERLKTHKISNWR